MRRLLISLTTVCLCMMVGCSSGNTLTSETATKENPLVLKLPHNMNEQHTVHIAISGFADNVFERTEGRVRIDIYPNAQLGSENEILEQLMAGIIPITKVSAPALATYNEGYHTFGLPYIFDDEEHYYRVMDSDMMRGFFESSEGDGFVGLTYYTSGSRSFYTAKKEIRKPEDLKGLKIRVQDMKSQTDMVKALGGTPVAMSYGDVYTALQTGIIDGTENNETALTTGKHGEVCKVYSYDQHSMIPDMLVISSKTWDLLSEKDREILIECAVQSTENHKIEWDAAVEEAVDESIETMNVEFVYDVDKNAFREATKDMVNEYGEKYPKVKQLVDSISKIQ